MSIFYIIMVVALVTMLTRALPFLLFRSKDKTPKIVLELGDMLPMAMIAMLVVYCLKDVNFVKTSLYLPQFIAAALVALLHIWKKNTLLSIGIGTLCYMVMVQCIF